METKQILVTGASGFIGSHLLMDFYEKGHELVGIDIKPSEFNLLDSANPTFEDNAYHYTFLDLRSKRQIKKNLPKKYRFDEIFALAADMGGMGFISQNHLQILKNNLRINLNTLDLAEKHNANVVFTSSACVYPEYKQLQTDVTPLKEEDAFPAQPQDAYGWEKLTAEQLYNYSDLNTANVRLHNVFGPYGTYKGGREKAPASLCRKIAYLPEKGGIIEIWGDGKQTRSFCFIDDAVLGLEKIMESISQSPILKLKAINLGSTELISIDNLAHLIANIADKSIDITHVKGPEGVRGRNSDNTFIKSLFDWEPLTTLQEGLEDTYAWINRMVQEDKIQDVS